MDEPVSYRGMTVEHHSYFTAVYWHGILSAQVFLGAQADREKIPDKAWFHLSTIATTEL